MTRDRLAVRALTVAIALLAATASLETAQLPQQSIPLSMPDGREFIVRIDPPAAATECQLDHFQTGAFGGFGGPMARPIGGSAFAIRTGVGDKPARALKVAVWCRGSGMALLDAPALDTTTYERTVKLVPLKELTLAGRVRPSADGVSLSGAELHVYYIAPWLCGFFNLADCRVPQWEVASARIGDDGTFRVTVPDVAADPEVARWASLSLGDFRLRADRNVPPHEYWLEQEGSTFGHVPVARTYPQVVLHPRRH